MATPLLFSGLVCSHAAWRAELTHVQCRLLPLKSQKWYWKAILWIPLGLFQGIIFYLAWDNYLERQDSDEEPETNSNGWNRFHCKAICALCEGLPAITVITCAWCSVNSPPDDPLMRETWPYEKELMRFLGFILFLSTGFGIMELDFCCSNKVAKKIQSRYYEVIHLLFRVSEVVSRTLMHVMFVVTTRRITFWWWSPAASNLLLSFLVTCYFGGDEKRILVRLLSCVPCMWVNIFFFVDSPYKRRAAKSISTWFDLRFLLEVFLMPMTICCIVASKDSWDDLHMIISTHQVMCGSLVLSLFIYFCLWIFMQFRVIWEIDLIDIFTASERGHLERLKDALETLVSEVRELTRSSSVEIDLNKPDVDGNTLLMLAAWQGHADVCDFLVKQGAFISITHKGAKNCRNWNTATWQDWTALHMAARHGKDEVIKVLIDNGALKEDRHYLDKRGQTPLHVAVAAKQVEAAATLANKCPDWTSAQDLRGRTPLDLANAQLREVLHAEIRPNESRRQSTVSTLSCPRLYSQSRRRGSSFTVGDWRSVPLHISRKRVQLAAPGLCSYVAASCGGALGRLCLAEAPEENVVENPAISLEDLEPITANGEKCSATQALIGEGAGGRVFRAKHRLQSSPYYAVKVFRSNSGSADRGVPPEVARECEVATCVRQTPHPCIVRLFMIFFDETSQLYTLVMEFCPSNLFRQILQAKEHAFTSGSGYLPPAQTLNWLGQIFLGLEHMHHRLNILFRDLKPENVMIDQTLCAKLADFGAGRFGASAGNFSFGHPAGTVGYCAPEVLYGHPHDEGADLYSLGVVTWLIFTGGMHNTAPPVSQRPEFSAHFHDWAQLHHCVQINFPPFRGQNVSAAIGPIG
ncbi:unnamed protein product [Durusdinium trenchii]|uniref:Protein kinase domain-containing protein n=2 Tax=Durusdinium trenchii TaxID=1381693 RepID=A0ABP0HMM3_9DINO